MLGTPVFMGSKGLFLFALVVAWTQKLAEAVMTFAAVKSQKVKLL